MTHSTTGAALACMGALALAGCKKGDGPAPAPAGPTHAATAGKLGFAVPDEVKSEPPSSPMRAAQFTFPRASGDSEDGQLVVFFFGAGQGGTVEANLNRWCAQVTAESGQSSCEGMSPTTFVSNGLKVTSVALKGHYKSQDMMTGATIDKPNHEMLAAVIEADDGNYFFKFDANAPTAQRWQPAFDALLRSIHKA